MPAIAQGFFELSTPHKVALIGGDLTCGPLSFSVDIYGLLPKGQALTRSGAQLGDLICVSGELGNGPAALKYHEYYR